MDFKSLTYTTFNELRTTSGVDGSSVKVLGKAVDNDGFGGIFYWDNSSVLPDDNFNVIQKTGLLQGRWRRLMFPGGGDSGSYVGGPGIDIVGNVISNSVYLDDIVSSSFNTGTGDLTLTTRGGVDIVTNLDGRYLTSSTDAQTLSWNEALSELSISDGNTVKLTGFLTLTALSATAPISYNSTTGVFSISQAGPTTDGYLSAADWNSFNNKQDPLGYVPENVANKTTNFNSPNHATYPSTQAVVDYIDSFDFGGVTSVDIADTPYITWSGGPITTSGVFTPILNSNLQGWGNLDTAAKEDSINKVTDFDNPNNTTFPTTQAVVDYLDDIDTGGTVTSVAMTVPEGFVVVGTPITTAGTLALGYASGYTYTKFDEKANWNSAYNNNIQQVSFNTATGDLDFLRRVGTTFTVNLDGRYLLSSDLDDYYTKTELQTSGQSSVHWDNITNTPSFLELSSLSATAPIVYNSTTGNFSISQSGATTDGYLSSQDWNTFNNKADAFSTGNIVAGTGVTFTGSGSNRLFGSGNLTIEVEPVDLSGYVPTTRTITIQGQAKDLTQDREWSLTTTDIPEGTNLYFTTSRARNSLSAGPGISYDPLTGVISNSAQGEEIELIEGANIIITGTAPSFTIAADLSNYYSKDDLETSGDSSVHWDNITDVPDFMENDLTVNAPLVYNPVLNHMHITAASASSDGFLTIADWVRFDGKADAFDTGNIIAGPGVSFTGTGVNRLFGTGDLTISADIDFSGYVPTSRTITINGTTYDLSGDRTWTIPVADGSETKINAGTGVTVTGSGTTGNPYVISSPYQTLSWNNTTKTISISNGNSQVLTGLVSSDVSITNSYGINIGGDLSTGLSIGLDTTIVDLRYLRKDVDDNNGSNKLTLGELEAGDTEITGTLTLGSVASGPMTNNFLTIDPATGEVEQTPLSVEIPELVIADGGGTTQFEVDLASENLKFVGTGDTAVSFNAATNTITINSVPGQGGGGAVTSFNGRDGAVVSITGDYNTSQVTETTNLYFTEPRVLSTVLTGFTPTFGTVTSTDTVLSAFEKLQSQLDSKTSVNTTLTVNGTSNRIVVAGGTQSLNADRVWTVDLAPIGSGGTYTKVSIDPFGRVILGENLQTSDLPISAGSGIAISPTGEISNTAQDQAISITGTGLTTVTGTYPSFTVDTTLIAGPGIDITGNTISSTATAPNLQQVTDVGNTTTNNIIVGSSTNNTKISALNVDIGAYDPTSTWSRSHSVTRYASGEPTHLVSFGAYGPSSGINYGYISSKLATPYSAADIKFIDGKVGINLSSDTVPAYNLEVIGNARISSIGNAVGDFVTASSTGVLSRRTAAQALSDMGGVSSSRNIIAGNGLTGGGTLASDVTLTIGTPGSITATSTNAVTATSHTHELAANAVTTAKILNSNVTFAKIQNIPTQTLIGRYSTGTGVAQSITLGTGLSLNSSGVLSATNTSAGTVTSVSSTVGGTALSVAVTNPTTTPNLAFDWEGTTSQYVTGAGTLVTFPSIPQGTVTSITIGNGLTGSSPITSTGTITLGTPGAVTLSSTNSVTASSHTHAFTPGGTSAQYIRGDGSLASFPSIPTVGNGTLSLNTSGIASGSGSFTANQSGNSSFTVNVPGTNVGLGTLTGEITSSTGSGTRLPTLFNPAIGSTDDAFDVKDRGLYAYATSATNTGFPSSTFGGGLTFVRNQNNNSGRFDLHNYNGSTDLWFSAGASAWDRVAGKDWVNAQGFLTSIPTLQQVTTVGNTSSNDIYFNVASGKLTKYGSSGITATDVVTYENPSNDNFTARIKGFNTWSSNFGSGWHFTTHNATSGAAGEVTALTLFPSGNARFPSLSGSGNRMVVANASGDLSTQAIPDVPTNYVTTNTTQTGLSGDKTSTGSWHFRWRTNSYYNDQDNNPRFYVGNAASGGTNGFIFRMSATTHRFQIRSFANDHLFHVYNDGTITAYGLAGAGTRMVVANSEGTLSTQAIPAYSGSTSITVSGTTISRPALTGDVTAPANSNVTTIANNAVTTAKIANNNVTLAKLEDLDQYEFIGRYSSGTGDPQKLKLGSGFDVDTTTGVVDVSGGGGGWIDEMGYDYEGNADNSAKGLDTRGGYATRPFVFINNSTIPDDVETCIFIGDKATLTIPDPALYENRVISIINRGGANLDLAGYLPIINVTVSATIDELISYYPGVDTGLGANSLEIQSIYNPITSTYIWVVLHFHFSNLQ